MKRTAILIVLLCIVCGCLLVAGCTNTSSTQQPTVTQKTLSTVRYGGQQYADEYVLAGNPDFWKKYGLDVKHTLFSSGQEGNEAILAGTVDINCGADSKTIAFLNAMPNDAMIIGTIERGNRYSTIVGNNATYKTWSDLKGKKVATRLGTGAEAILRKYYAQNGFKWEDFEYVNLKIEDMPAALAQGQIEAFTAWEPTPAIAEAKGFGKLFMTYGSVDIAPVSLQTTKKYATAHEDEIVRFLAAHLDKADLIKNNPKLAAQYASKATADKGITVAPEAFEKVFERIDFSIDFDDSIIENINSTAKFLYDGKQIKTMPVILYDRSYLEKAKQLRQKTG